MNAVPAGKLIRIHSTPLVSQWFPVCTEFLQGVFLVLRRSALPPARAQSNRYASAETENQEVPMNWDQVEGKWKQFSGKTKEKWGRLTDDDLEVIRGRRDQLIGKIQERYGIMKQEAEKQVDEFVRSCRSEDSTVETP